MTDKINYKKLIPLYKKGMSIIDIGKLISRDNSNVSRGLRNAGVKMRSGKPKGIPCPFKGKPLLAKRKINYNQVIALYKTERSTSKVAKLLNCGAETVRQALHKEEIQLEPRGAGRGKKNHQYK